MDSPFSRVPEQGPDWFLVATEACGGGTPDLGYFLGVSVFIGGFGVEKKLGDPRGVHEAQGAPPTLVGPTGLPSDNFSFQYFLYFPKKIFVDF